MSIKKKRSIWQKIKTGWLVFIFVYAFIGGMIRMSEIVFDSTVERVPNDQTVTVTDHILSMVPLSDYEITHLFPHVSEDWSFIEKLTGVGKVRMPKIFYQDGRVSSDWYSAGTFFENIRAITLDRENFGTSTPEYARYVLLHELAHSAITLGTDWDQKEDQHCYMVRKGIFEAIGRQIGNEELGHREKQFTARIYKCKE